MERTERLLDLVALLLDSREPVSWAELREAFDEDYGQGTDEAAERKFERDKAELLELGIPIAYVQGDDDRKDGYVVDREAYYLPEAGLTPEELAVLYAAGSAALASGAFPGRHDLAHALRKVGFFAGLELPTPRLRVEAAQGGAELPPKLEELWGAAAARKFVQMTYYSPRSDQQTERRLDPYGLALRQGIWSVVGYCHLRKDIRTFHVHRIRSLSVNPSKPRTPDFEVPKDFRLDDYVASHPWQYGFHDPIEVKVRLLGELAPLAGRLFPASKVERKGSEAHVAVRVTYLDGFVRYALSLGPGCKVLAPAEALTRWREMANRVLAAHLPRTKAAIGGAR